MVDFTCCFHWGLVGGLWVNKGCVCEKVGFVGCGVGEEVVGLVCGVWRE